MTHGGIRDTMNPSKDLEVHTMKRGSFAAGFLTCLLVVGVTTTAYAAGIVAERSTHRVFVDGREVQMEAYRIKGNNYVKLRDMGEAVGFEVYWDSANAVCRWKAASPTPEKHLQRQNPINRNRIQNPQPLPMMPMWMP